MKESRMKTTHQFCKETLQNGTGQEFLEAEAEDEFQVNT